MSLENLVLAESLESFNSDKTAAIRQLSDVFSPDEWGFDVECVEYAGSNVDNLWNHQLRRGVIALLEASGKSIEDYGQFLGKVHFTSVAVYSKRLFPRYKRNEGWRILLLGIPAARVLVAGLESNYQGGPAAQSDGGRFESAPDPRPGGTEQFEGRITRARAGTSRLGWHRVDRVARH